MKKKINSTHVFLVVCIIFIIIPLIVFAINVSKGIKKYFGKKEVDFGARYGSGSWVVITGASSGQGRHFALSFAQRGFNLLLIGSPKSHKVKFEIEQQHAVQVRVLIKDFSNAFQNDFFNDIQTSLLNLPGQISILINNIGHRSGWIPYHEMPPEHIRDTIACGTIVQSRMVHMVLPLLLENEYKSAMVTITAQCVHPNFGFGSLVSNEIYLPYMSVYEASNAFGYFHANSIFQEYKGQLDMLIITPGAVLTENTPYLKNTPGRIAAPKFVANIMKLIGNHQGIACGSWKHAILPHLVNLAPFLKNRVLTETGRTIAQNFMFQHFN